MRSPLSWILAGLVLLTAPEVRAQAAIRIDAVANASSGGSWVEVSIPVGATVDVSVTGEAFAAPGLPFRELILERHSPATGVAHDVLGRFGSIRLREVDAIRLYFLDDDPSDNSGEFLVHFAASGGDTLAPARVVAAEHCLDLSRSVRVTLDESGWNVWWSAQTSGDAWIGRGQRGRCHELLLMYDRCDSPKRPFHDPERTCAILPIGETTGESRRNAPEIHACGASVWFILPDTSTDLTDNGGEIIVRLLRDLSPGNEETWGGAVVPVSAP